VRRVIVRPAARADIVAAYRWYEKERNGLGTAFLRAIRAAMGTVGENPEVYAVVRGDIRRVNLHRFPYALFYRFRAELIIVIACMHGSRDPKRWESRI
jgi:plasmid stabilization system protein ParE